MILDVVYEHVDPMFPYNYVYGNLSALAGAPAPASPMMDGQNIYGFGPKPDFTLPFTLDYFQNANQHWLDEFHVDGFRYDEVTDLYVPPMDAGYRTLVEQTYLHSLTLPRFEGATGSYSRIVQCAEALGKAQTVLSQSYTNAAWQDGLLNLAESVVSGTPPQDSYAHQLDPGFMGYPATTAAVDAAGNAIQMPVAPFQYIESHDHSQLITFASQSYDAGDPIPEGDRSLFYKLQPHAIALYTLQGVPMLWQGQEFADNYSLPGTGLARVHLQRDTHWEYFYDSNGTPLVNLYRRLGALRRSVRALRSRASYYYWQQSLQGRRSSSTRATLLLIPAVPNPGRSSRSIFPAPTPPSAPHSPPPAPGRKCWTTPSAPRPSPCSPLPMAPWSPSPSFQLRTDLGQERMNRAIGRAPGALALNSPFRLFKQILSRSLGGTRHARISALCVPQ